MAKKALGKAHAASHLLAAAMERTVEPSPAKEPWVYGWCVEEHRRSPQAVIPYGQGKVIRFSPAGVAAVESGVRALLAMPTVRSTWDEDELWGVVAQAIAQLPITDAAATAPAVDHCLERILTSGPTLVVFRLAHVRWNIAPKVVVPRCLIGRAGLQLREAVASTFDHVCPLPEHMWRELEGENTEGEAPVVFAACMNSAKGKAVRDAEHQFDDLVRLSILFDGDKEGKGLYSLRGPAFRPGVRGLVIDRHALEALGKLRAREIFHELSATIYLSTKHGRSKTHRWYGESLWPLDDLLTNPFVASVIAAMARENTPFSQRVRVAARWHEEAHWELNRADALIALGIAADALLAERGGSPGRVLAERYALLHADPAQRSDAQRFFAKQIYEPRSAVAHGAISSVQGAPVREIERRVSWIARTLWRLAERDRIRTDADHSALFDGLKWGTRSPLAIDAPTQVATSSQASRPHRSRQPG